jgi:hypothetical protein
VNFTDGEPNLDQAETRILRGKNKKNSGKRHPPLL